MSEIIVDLTSLVVTNSALNILFLLVAIWKHLFYQAVQRWKIRRENM